MMNVNYISPIHFYHFITLANVHIWLAVDIGNYYCYHVIIYDSHLYLIHKDSPYIVPIGIGIGISICVFFIMSVSLH